MTKQVANSIIADMAARLGYRAEFVAEYLNRLGYTPLDLSRAVIGAAVAGTLRGVAATIWNDEPLSA